MRWPTTTTPCRGRQSSSAARAPLEWSCAARPTTTWRPVTSNRTFRIGLLGHGTVGSAFAKLLPRQADRIERITGLRPSVSGILTRGEGSFDDLLESSELIV